MDLCNFVMGLFSDFQQDEQKKRRIEYCKYWINQNKLAMESIIEDNKLLDSQLMRKYNFDYTYVDTYIRNNVKFYKFFQKEIVSYDKIIKKIEN